MHFLANEFRHELRNGKKERTRPAPGCWPLPFWAGNLFPNERLSTVVGVPCNFCTWVKKGGSLEIFGLVFSARRAYASIHDYRSMPNMRAARADRTAEHLPNRAR